jgi:hypothetical protein
MCFDVLKNPVKAIIDAKKKKNMTKTVIVLIESAVFFALSAGIIVASTGLYDALLLSSVISMFVIVLVAGLLMGFVFYVAASTLGGKGGYFEGLTATSYALLPISIGVLISSILMVIPFTSGLQVIVLAFTFALGFGIVYRGLKELYSMDMVTTLVVVSVSIVAIIMGIYASVGLSMLARVALISPV